MHKIRHCRLSIKRTGSYLLKKKFFKNEKKVPAPIVIFYKKKQGIKHLNLKLIDDLYRELNIIYDEFNKKLSGLTDKKEISEHKNDYQKKIERLAITLFSSLAKTSPSSIIEGIVLDKFFIGHKHGKLFIKDCFAQNVTNKDDSFLTKQPFSTPSIPNHLSSKVSGLILDYKNNLQSKYDRATINTAKDRLEKKINLTLSLHNALFSRNNSALQSALQELKNSNNEKHAKFKYKLLSTFHFKPKSVRIIENIEALTQQHPLYL